MRQTGLTIAALVILAVSPPRAAGGEPSSEPSAAKPALDDGSVVVLELNLPGLAARPLDVDIVGDAVRLRYSAEVPAPKGGAVLLDARRVVEKLFAIPSCSDPKSARVERDGDAIRITVACL